MQIRNPIEEGKNSISITTIASVIQHAISQVARLQKDLALGQGDQQYHLTLCPRPDHLQLHGVEEGL